MNWVDKLSVRTWSILVIGMLAFAISGCEGDTGPEGPQGPQGPEGPQGPQGDPGPVPSDVEAAIANADAESCQTCHGESGDYHQATYDAYVSASDYTLNIIDVTVAGAAAPYTMDVFFSIDYMGEPLIDPDGAPPSVDLFQMCVIQTDIDTDEFVNSGGGQFGFPCWFSPTFAASNGDGTYNMVVDVPYDFSALASRSMVGKIGVGLLDIEAKQAGKRVAMYEHLSTAGYLAGGYSSVANPDGCEACHSANGVPYRKHGNYEAVVQGSDFVLCRACHTDDRSGGHPEWQFMVDDPFAWATGEDPTGDYDYIATLMNDTHMSHALEFPYPQSMANCVTCHEGFLTEVLDDANFDLQFCKSCHVIDGVDAQPGELYYQAHRPPPMQWLWDNSSVPGVHNVDMTCSNCHGTAGFSAFSDMHSGWDESIYNVATGNAWADEVQVWIKEVQVNGDLFTVSFGADAPDVNPTLAISFYGWDTKHFIVAAHERDGNGVDCAHPSRPGCNIEWSIGSTKPFFTEEAGSVPGDWIVTFDASLFQAVKTDPIPQLIADEVVKYIEVAVLPRWSVDGVTVQLEAVSETYDLTGLYMADYFQGTDATVDFDKCVSCHDNLSTIVHAGRGRFGDSMQTCKACHATTFAGSHLEMASRSIDSYVHAIHTFQPFDEGEVLSLDDPVFDARNEMHKTHVFPNFTALSCEGCHMEGTYNAVDQSKSLFGIQAASDDEIPDRSIGTIAESVTGPSSRACGGCHRANMIIDDRAGDLATFNAHVDTFGTFEENDADDEVAYGIIDKIMEMFR